MPSTEPEKLSGSSMDIAASNKERLKQLFPTVFTETKNAQGDMTESIDFEKLKAELGTFSELFESRRERYGMEWPGKREALHLAQTPTFATLKPCRKESVNFDTTENLFIEGDNLEVLKLLQTSYYGKVKMIYIDPPYNTGKEFIYPDNYTESIDTYLEYAGQEGRWKDSQTPNSGDNPRYHTRWLNMMFPRLYLAKNLLRDDGVIFISIDDNEVSNLRKVCDEIFGEDSFIGELTWESTTQPDNIGKARFGLQKKTEYIIFYSKCNKNSLPPFLLNSLGTEKKYPHEGKFGKCRFEIIERAYDGAYARPTMRFKILNQYPRQGKQWQIGETLANELEALGKVEIVDGIVKRAVYPEDEVNNSSYEPFWSHLTSTECGTSQKGKALLTATLDASVGFETVKPTELINKLCKHFPPNSIILDFFAGSATTAHAILELNKQDETNRKFILVQLPEPCAPDSEAFKEGYNNIADIGKERIRRVITKLNAEEEGQLDLNQSGTQDRGFKVMKLDKSNFKQWQPLPPDASIEQISQQLELHINHIDPKATAEDLLYEILLKSGFALTEPVETITLADKKVFSVAGGALLLCLEDTITKELIDAVVKSDPIQFICLDSAFHGNDQLKANTMQTFAARNMQKEKHNQISFKTV